MNRFQAVALSYYRQAKKKRRRSLLTVWRYWHTTGTNKRAHAKA
jgi:hypothetical protein